MQAWWAEETSLKQYLKILRFKFFDWYCIVLYIYIYIYIYIWYTIPVSVCVGVCGLVVGRARLPGPKNARDDFFLSQPWLVIPGNDWWSFCLNKLLIPTGGLINMRTVALTWDVRIERMNEGCIYIALYCVLLYTQSTLQSCVCVCVCVCGGGGLSSTTTSVQHPLGWCDGCHRTNSASVLTTHQLQVERWESHRANQVDGDY